ncbi:MAG: hypothetical protein II272_07745, partial [Oscillospiraceae bacterium]|nr:hypothetical protein [Oscillospiraceae bacterium]
MQKFECIMNQSELNYKRYRKLISAYQRKASDLVCFVGAGLSLYSKAWGEPFTRIVEDLKCKLDDRHTYYCRRENQISSSIHPDKQEHQRTIAEIIDKLKNAITQIKDIDETYVKQKLFMEAGDEINKILECLCKPQNIITGNNGDN